MARAACLAKTAKGRIYASERARHVLMPRPFYWVKDWTERRLEIDLDCNALLNSQIDDGGGHGQVLQANPGSVE